VGGGTDEVTSDIEDVIGLAPKADIEVYEAVPLPGPMVDEYQRIADDDNAQVVSTSWSIGCESLGLGSFGLWLTSPYMAAEDQIFSQMALQGQTMLASSGDMGSEACGGTGLAVQYPASDPMLTGVGGTQLSGTPPTEMAWNSTCANGPCGGGGGISSVWAMPSWQKAPGVPSSRSSGSPCGASPGSAGRYQTSPLWLAARTTSSSALPATAPQAVGRTSGVPACPHPYGPPLWP
jgi:subtilase family serine protease